MGPGLERVRKMREPEQKLQSEEKRRGTGQMQ